MLYTYIHIHTVITRLSPPPGILVRNGFAGGGYSRGDYSRGRLIRGEDLFQGGDLLEERAYLEVLRSTIDNVFYHFSI